MDRHTGKLRESCHHGKTYGLNHLHELSHLYGLFLVGFLWPVVLLCQVLSSCLVHVRVLPHVPTHLLAKKDSSKEACG